MGGHDFGNDRLRFRPDLIFGKDINPERIAPPIRQDLVFDRDSRST